MATVNDKKRQDRIKRVHRSDALVDGVWMIHAKADYYPEHYGPTPVWQDCFGVEKDAREVEERFRDLDGDWKCVGCSGVFLEDEMTKGEPSWESASGMFPPPHKRLIDVQEQARDKLIAGIEAMGLDPHDESLREVVWSVRDQSRNTETVTSLLAKASFVLAEKLTRRAAVEQTAAAVKELLKVNVSDEFCGFPDIGGYEPTKEDHNAPFFTEAFLYNLLGKEAARTVLAYIGKVERASGS